MTETIQMTAPHRVETRRDFLVHAATMYGTSLSVAQLDQLDDLPDVEAIARAFPWHSDAERDEALWALGAALG